eukprot:CAMPEP_0194221614 /NCGR_PEP_ID=MMETSP0156-20130528/30974_1 /TAXON_ID=33649 /ORGANISM="Thalassionema nitzschioides, Strain L26-B" /LENGTH=2052 /DNA_ID=CAMNT_0038952077 /DNA_START=235 /DNA_END=6393 /DNA_ORIENTATION=+
MATIGLLTLVAFIPLRTFAKPKPVPLKVLPRRPALQIHFKPDDILPPACSTSTGASVTTETETRSVSASQAGGFRVPGSEVLRRSNSELDDSTEALESADLPHSREASFDDDSDGENDSPSTTKAAESPFTNIQDLPDSFAPLLSSSNVEFISNQLTADLIHAVKVKGGIRIREGRQEIPLDKDNSRPQFIIDPPKGGCRVSAVVTVGSDGLTPEEDLDVNRLTTSRSHPMVKNAGVVLDPPLPLANVAPTLIHFPTLFEDRYLVASLRSRHIIRIIVNAIASLSSFLEKVLWIIESQCQIHLSKVQITPLYKGRRRGEDSLPEWRLSLSFSGHVLLFGWIPIPFISVTLPSFIIPQPHALLEFLMTPEPFASAKLRRENIAEKPLALAGFNAIEGWNIEVKAVATPPALGVDVTLPGGVAIAIEMMPGRDHGAGMRRDAGAEGVEETGVGSSADSMSSWSTRHDSQGNHRYGKRSVPSHLSTTKSTGSGMMNNPSFDANELVPWFFHLIAKGHISQDRMSLNIIKCSATHNDNKSRIFAGPPTSSSLCTTGNISIWKADLSAALSSDKVPSERRASYGHMLALSSSEEAPSLGEILLYHEENNLISSPSSILGYLQYDYAFDVYDSQIDAVTCSVGASHPMLVGGTMITTIFESIYMHGSATARQGAIIDPGEWKRKRNILRHLPAVDLTFGVQNVFIPPESLSYSDTGNNMCIPELEGGRVMIRILGGIADTGEEKESEPSSVSPVIDGIKVIADIGVEAVCLDYDSSVMEFPELEIFDGAKLKTLISGAITGQLSGHLRPQTLPLSSRSTTGPNRKNPLEAYEVDFSTSSVAVKIKECSTTLGHRRVVVPTETFIGVKIVESVVDMSLEGKTQCELSWDFQGLSPILQVTKPGQSPAQAMHENRRQISILIPPLRQGRLNFHVSSVGGIAIKEAKTSREDREGLYDWKFFNALVSPDEESPERLLKVVHDKRSMEKLLQVLELINADLHKIMRYVLTQIWRAKEIFDQEGIEGPGHAIPGHKLARLISLFICGDVSQVAVLVPIIRRVTSGGGLDVVKVKELLRQHVEAYEEWAPEIDRVIRWVAIMLDPMVSPQMVVEHEVPPLCEVQRHAAQFRDIPSARELYDRIQDKPQLPLAVSFSNLLSGLSPYLSFSQVKYVLEVRRQRDWQPSDLRRIRYVYAVKKKVLDISESYGGLSFLPQSFLVSVFLGEATRASMRASRHLKKNKRSLNHQWSSTSQRPKKDSTLSTLRRRRMQAPKANPLGDIVESSEEYIATPAGLVSRANLTDERVNMDASEGLVLNLSGEFELLGQYELGDSLLGPADVAVLLQAGLTSAMKESTVVQLNQRMLLDLIATQPRSFAIAVLAEIGNNGGQGSPRGLTSALMALLDLQQSSFTPVNRLDMHALLESWLPGFKIPRRSDYMAGGRWARQSYYEAIFSVAKGIIEDAECYIALKSHIQQARYNSEDDSLPQPREYEGLATEDIGLDLGDSCATLEQKNSKLMTSTDLAKKKIMEADRLGHGILTSLIKDEEDTKKSGKYKLAIKAYQEAFEACSRVLELDKLAFQTTWFREFYNRNYDALMISSMHSNVISDVDKVRHWFSALRRGSSAKTVSQTGHPLLQLDDTIAISSAECKISPSSAPEEKNVFEGIGEFISNIGKPKSKRSLAELSGVDVFENPEQYGDQILIDAIIDAIVYRVQDREKLKNDPLVRLLIPNPPGKYDFAIVSAMGVITEGERGMELNDSFQRVKELRGVELVRSDTGTARSVEYNAMKIIEAIESVADMGKPYGLLGYSQGCANALMAESLLLSGSPKQRAYLTGPRTRLVCRHLMFSAANGSTHGPAADVKAQRLIVMCEEFFKYQQGYFSRAFASFVLQQLTNFMDSAPFQKGMGGAQSFLPDGCRAFWREAQHLPHIPTCTMRGVLENHTLPESLEMISHLLTKQSGSALHDSQVHVYDAVGYPVYCVNRNGRLLKNCAVGNSAIQRTHHWSPLSEEVEFVETKRDQLQGSFECAKDRHVFPWIDVNARFGFIKYVPEREKEKMSDKGV